MSILALWELMLDKMEGKEGVVEACKTHGLSAPQQDCAVCQAYRVDRDLRLSGIYLNEENEIPANVKFKGKVAELRAELTNSGKKDKNHASKKNALKKIVANMTMSNNDMVALFPDVINCMQIPVLEVKKMYYHLQKALYIPLIAILGAFSTCRIMLARSPTLRFGHSRSFKRYYLHSESLLASLTSVCRTCKTRIP